MHCPNAGAIMQIRDAKMKETEGEEGIEVTIKDEMTL